MTTQLSERKREVLYAVVNNFIVTAEPVGSQQIAQAKGISLSPATVRTVMAELEELGFLRQPHTSAGRIPTDLGYRFYVDQLMRLQPLTSNERNDIRSKMATGTVDLSGALKDTCKLISTKAKQAGLVLAPPMDNRSFQHIQFVSLKSNLALAVLVSSGGIVENKIIEIGSRMTQLELDRMSNYLNERMAGQTIAEVRQKLLLEMKSAQSQYDEILNKALLLATRTLSDSPAEMHIEGQRRLLAEPEFADVEKMQLLLRILEEKTEIMRLLEQSLHSPGIKIHIGEETHVPEIQGLTLITTAYSDPEGNRGLLGVIGPKRMNYARIVPLVEFTAQIMTDVLQERDHHD